MRVQQITILGLFMALLVFMQGAVMAQVPQSNSQVATVTHDATWSGTTSNVAVVSGNLQISTYPVTLTQTYSPSGNYYQSVYACNRCAHHYSWTYYPPYGGTMLQAYVYLRWYSYGCCSRRQYLGYLQRGNGTNLYSGGDIGWRWIDFADYAATTGIRVDAYWKRKCCGTWTAYLRYVQVRENRTRYYTSGDYYSPAIDRNSGGHKGYDWGMIWWSVSVPSSTGYTVYVRGSDSTTFTTTWQAVSYGQNINQVMGAKRYLQYRIRLTGPGSYLPDANGTPTFNWIKVQYYYDDNFNDPEAHDNEFWRDSTASFSQSGVNWDSNKVINADYGLRLNQYTAIVQYAPSGNYYASIYACNRCAHHYTWNYYPPNGGTIRRAYVYLRWYTYGCCSRRQYLGYLQKASGTNLYSGGDIGWRWLDFADYASSQGIRVDAYWRRKCCGTWTAYLRYVEVSELKFYTGATYTSEVLDYGDTGFSWAHAAWRCLNLGGGRAVTFQIRAASDSAFTTNLLNWTTLGSNTAELNNYNLATAVGAGRRFLQYRFILAGLATSTPYVDWLTIKYYTDAKPTITITSTDKGVQPPGGSLPATPPDRWKPIDDGWHEKPPLTGNPANDYLYATVVSNMLPVSQLGINITISDPESDPIKTVEWEYSGNFTDDGDDSNDLWFGIDTADMEWADGGTADITSTRAGGNYKIIWKNINNYLAGVYQDMRFRCKANDLIFDSDLAAMSTPFFVDENAAPTIDAASFTILPDPAYTTDTLTLNTSTSASDVDTNLNNIHTEDDNNILSYITSWDVNGIDVAGITQPVLPSSYFIKGDVVTAKVYPYDGKEFGEPRDKAITIQNKPPVITSITLSPATPYTDDDLICTVVATDDDEFIWRETDFRSATVDNVDNGAPFDAVNCDGNITTTDVDQDSEWELQLK